MMTEVKSKMIQAGEMFIKTKDLLTLELGVKRSKIHPDDLSISITRMANLTMHL